MAKNFFNPEELPPFKVDADLPRPPEGSLGAEALRQRFRSPPLWTPQSAVEPRLPGLDRPLRAAAVLIALVGADSGLNVLLTQRTDHLTHHPGQISFPGGRSEPEDADATATALREAEEEIGLQPDFVDVLGRLPLYTTGTGFEVTPVVALVRKGFALKPDPGEVAHVFKAPLAFLMDPSNHRWHAMSRDGIERQFLSMVCVDTDEAGQARSHFVWGATAAILRNLYRFVLA